MSSQSKTTWKWKGTSRRGGRGRPSSVNSNSRRSSPSTAGPGSNNNNELAPSSFLDSKPREEKHYTEFYPDLDEERPLKVFIVSNFEEEEEEDLNSVNNSNINNQNTHLKRPVFRKTENAIEYVDKLNRKMISVGYNNLNESHNNNKLSRTLHNPYIRPDITSNTFTNNTLTKNDKFQVMYDMDEQDSAFIDLLNQNSQEKLSYELLEIVFTFLEREWYLLEKILPPKKKSFDSMNSDEMIDKATQHTSIYGSDDGSGGRPEEDQCCAVCNESECDNSNAIVFCDGCDIAVHQECYGVVFIPEGQWLCRRCLISRNNKSQCLFCPSKTGAFKQTENGSWCHVICALWINELYFANPIYMEPVEGLDLIPKSRWRLNCYICRQKIGACIQCSNRNCFQLYHVTCARRSDLYMHAKNGTQHALSNPSSLVSYCDKHGPASHNLQHDTKTGIEKTRLYFATVGAIKDNRKSQLKSTIKIQHKSKESPFRWKSDFDTPIAPELFATRLKQFLNSSLNIIVDQETIYKFCSYWSLKREFKRGASLIKRLDAPQFGALSSQEIDERLKFLETLTEDVDRLCELSTKVSQRTAIESKLIDFKLLSLDLLYFPVNYIIGQLTERIIQLMDGNNSLTNFQISEGISFVDILDKINNYSYHCVSDFIKDFKQLMDHINSSQAVALKKTAVRWKKEMTIRYKSALTLETAIKHLLKSNREKDLVDLLSQDVFEISGMDIDLEKWQGAQVAEELTDVEELEDEEAD